MNLRIADRNRLPMVIALVIPSTPIAKQPRMPPPLLEHARLTLFSSVLKA
jgi:hypothetical protein